MRRHLTLPVLLILTALPLQAQQRNRLREVQPAVQEQQRISAGAVRYVGRTELEPLGFGRAQQGSVDPALMRGMKYRQVGPPRGGRVTPVTGVPSQPQTFYMGVASGGVFRTTNSGQSW